MTFLQVPNTDDIAQDLSKTAEGLEKSWTHFWSLFTDNPGSAMKYLGGEALHIAIKIAIALAIFYAGRWLIRKAIRLLDRIFEKQNVDTSVRIFVDNLVSIILWLVVVVIIVRVLNIETTGLVAILAASAFAIGMALSGTLSNFAGGILILLRKPFRLGEYIEAQGYSGTVRTIQLFSTVIITPDNKTVIIPNGPLSTGTINNFSRQNTRRVEWKIGISYGDDFDRAQNAIAGVLDKDTRIIKDLGYTIAINELAESSVVILVQCWVKSSDFLAVFYDMNRHFYIELPANNINFPFSQMDVRLINLPPAQEKTAAVQESV